MLELVIAVVVALVVGLLIGVTAMAATVQKLKLKITELQEAEDEFCSKVYGSIDFQMNLIRMHTLTSYKATLSNAQRKRLRRLGSQLLRIKDKDEDHPDSVERQ